MALGDILAGFAEAGHQHATNLFNMAQDQKKELVKTYADIAQSQDYPEEVRAEALKRHIDLNTLEPGKKIPKEIQNLQFTIAPKPAGPPVQLPSAPAVNPALQSTMAPGPVVPGAPAQPPRPMTMAPFTPEQLTAQAGERAGAVASATAAAQEPAKAAALKATSDAKKAAVNAKLITDGMKLGQVPQFNEENDFTGYRPMTKDEQSALQSSVVNKNQSTADVNAERIRVGALAKTETSQLQVYHAYRDQQIAAGKEPLMLDDWLAKVANMKPTAPRTHVIRTVDENGDPVSMIVGDTVGASWKATPPVVEQTRKYQANLVSGEVDNIVDMIEKNPDMVGPILGRIENGELKVGTVDPKFSGLVTSLGSLTAMMPILHGFRGGSQAMDHFSTIIGDPHLNKAALRGSLMSIKRLAEEIKSGKVVAVDENGEPIVASAAKAPTPPPGNSATTGVRNGTIWTKDATGWHDTGKPAK